MGRSLFGHAGAALTGWSPGEQELLNAFAALERAIVVNTRTELDIRFFAEQATRS
jgi:hypothetical protein